MKTYLSGTDPHREELFNEDWQFVRTDNAETPGDYEQWQTVQLPHDWSIHTLVRQNNPAGGSGGYFECGIGWYRKQFIVARRSEESVVLYFEGVYKDCDVWINQIHVRHHDYGYTSFSADITGALRDGVNECLVRVNNADVPNSRWYSGSGITRNVRILALQPVHFTQDGIFITTSGVSPASVNVCLETSAEADGLSAHLEILDEGKCVQESVIPIPGQKAEANLTLPEPKCWSPDHPFLYRLRATLLVKESVVDQLETPFGVRDAVFTADKGFLLNGERVKLNGVCLHHDGGCVGAAVPPAVWRRRFRKLKEMGCNAIRCAHNPPDPAFLDLCDEMGFLVNAEIFDEWREVKRKTWNNLVTDVSHGYGEVFDRCAEEDTVDAVRRDRNHPSIILWSVGNEIPEQTEPEGVTILKKLASLVRREDPTRLITTANDNMHANPKSTLDDFMNAADVIGDNYIDRWGMHTETMYEPDKIAHPNRIYYGSEHSAIYGWRGDYSDTGKTTSWFLAPYQSRMLKAERLMKFTLSRDWVCGDFMWTGIDHLGESDWPRRSSISGVIDTAGFEKDGFYFYQSQWVKDRPVLHLFPWLNLDIPEGQVIPFVAYTNCPYVELFVDHVSWGMKSYEFPSQGMRNFWDDFERPIREITTNDLHLSWDIPFHRNSVIEAIGYDDQRREIIRKTLKAAGAPAELRAAADTLELSAEKREVVQLEITLLDKEGIPVPDQDQEIALQIEGPIRLLGMDNGKNDSHEPFDSSVMRTNRGLLYAILQSTGEKGEATIHLRSSTNLQTILSLISS